MTAPSSSPALTAPTAPQAAPVAVVVPHTHWDREWYAPFETLRFHLVRFLDELIETLENEPGLPVFLLDGQSVILEDYLEIRPARRPRVEALVRAGRLRPGPFYVQPDEFHVSGESMVRNLLTGIRVAADFGWVMREGYLPDTFGHVDQLPQILQGFGIETFYAMRGFADGNGTGPQGDAGRPRGRFRWQAPDGSQVLAEWLTESYSNAAVLTHDATRTALHHGTLVHYDSLTELLGRLADRAPGGALLLLNGGDHLRVQQDLPETVAALDAQVPVELRLGGLEEFHALAAAGAGDEPTVTGELRGGGRHDVFTGIASTRTPMKRDHDRVETRLLSLAERLDALAFAVSGHSSLDSLRYAWRELLKNHAHDSICGCSVDEVHREVAQRLAKAGQVAAAVEQDALECLAHAVVPRPGENAGDTGDAANVPLVVVNPSPFPRSGTVTAEVLPDPGAPLGERRFGWVQGAGTDLSTYTLLDAHGRVVPFTVRPAAGVSVADPLDRRKELLRDRVTFRASDVPALGTAVYRLLPPPQAADAADAADGAQEAAPQGGDEGREGADGTPVCHPARTGRARLDNGVLRVETSSDGTLTLTHLASGTVHADLLELLDDGDRGDEYGFGPVGDDTPVSSAAGSWHVTEDPARHTLRLCTVLGVPTGLATDRRTRSPRTVGLPVSMTVRLEPGADTADVQVTVTNRALDHRLRIRFPGLAVTGRTTAETAFGTIERDHRPQEAERSWHEPPTGAVALRRFVLGRDPSGATGLQVVTEGLHEYTASPQGAVDLTLLRSVGWLARTDHPLRPHKVGPHMETPEAQCPGEHTFRFALRPFAGDDGPAAWFRAAEVFGAPLRAVAVQGRRRSSPGTALPGLEITPGEAVLSALKTSENGEGVVVRVFNSSGHPFPATLTTGFDLSGAALCDLEEKPGERLAVTGRRTVSLPLAPHRIATVLLTPERTGTDRGGRA